MILNNIRQESLFVLGDIEPGDSDSFEIILFQKLLNDLIQNKLSNSQVVGILKELLKIILIEETKTGLFIIDDDRFYNKIFYQDDPKSILNDLDGFSELLSKPGHDRMVRITLIGNMFVGVFNLALSLEVFNELINEKQSVELW